VLHRQLAAQREADARVATRHQNRLGHSLHGMNKRVAIQVDVQTIVTRP
jgi:hypothetical protein